MGAADGIHILDNTDPASPENVGDFQHATAIDPVVAQNGIAYVTLKRDLTQPGPGIANQMNIVDISDVTQPVLLDTLSMQGPAGLTVQGDRLHRTECLAMIKRRCRQAGIDNAVNICNHTFRGTGITAYLSNDDAKLDHAQNMAGHADAKTTLLYDRRSDEISLDEVEKIGI